MRVPEGVFNSNFRLLLRGERPRPAHRAFSNKMVVYSRNDPLLRITFSFSLKDVASDWFYSLSSPSP